MKTISVSELKSRLSESLRLIKSGERLLVTERGLPVAIVEPPPLSEDALLERLQDQGLARVGKEPLSASFFRRARPADPAGSVRRALIEERSEHR